MNKIYNIIARRSIFQSTRLLCFCHQQVKLHYYVNHDIWMNNFIQDSPNLSIIKRFKHKKKNLVKIIKMIVILYITKITTDSKNYL